MYTTEHTGGDSLVILRMSLFKTAVLAIIEAKLIAESLNAYFAPPEKIRTASHTSVSITSEAGDCQHARHKT